MPKINFSNLPKSARVAIAVGIPLLYLVVFGFLAIKPNYDKKNVLKKDISVQENDIAKSRSMAMRLDELKVENENLKEKLEELSQRLPEEKEVSALLKQVSEAGITSGLRILSWIPGQRTLHASKIVYLVPVNVTLEGSYHRLGHFFSSLTRLNRIVNISNIKLTAPKPSKEEAILSVGFTAVTFTAATEGGLSKEGGPAGEDDAAKTGEKPKKGKPAKGEGT